MKKVSIICMDNMEINSACIASLLKQTLTNIEIILPHKHYIKDSRIVYNASPSGEFFMWIDMNCTFAPNMLDVMVKGMDRARASLGICGCMRKGEKNAVTTSVVDTDDKKLALIQRLIKKNLFLTLNNAVIRNNGDNNFISSYASYVKNERIHNFSNTFVIGESGLPPKEPIFDMLDYFLSRRSL